jgi:hypothetical protein
MIRNRSELFTPSLVGSLGGQGLSEDQMGDDETWRRCRNGLSVL